MDHLKTPATKFTTAELLTRIRRSNGTTPSRQPNKEANRDPTPLSSVSIQWDNGTNTPLPRRQSLSSLSSSKPPPPPPTSSTILTYQRESNNEIQRLQHQINELTKQNEALHHDKKSLKVKNNENKRKTNDAMARLRGD